ncbi:hypothetical protein PQX77_015314 [Marasmius sp. AFHP31]|nr:hypothetical protein PQX77_015314 [Marasmius sp. AFHP31]
MSSTKTETKIETKTETPKGKERAAPRGEEPPRPGTPPDNLGGSDDEQGSDDRRSSNSWRFTSTTQKEPPDFKERGRKPDVFTGKREELEDFLTEFGRYLCLNKAIYPGESEKIDLFLLFIKHAWARHRSKEVEEDYVGKDTADQRWKTWCDLHHRLREDFKPHDREGTVEQKLDTIWQTGELVDIDKFNKVFNKLAADSDVESAA